MVSWLFKFQEVFFWSTETRNILCLFVWVMLIADLIFFIRQKNGMEKYI
tara:strand:- start:4925 stop:5071 length:147 start_codon:yes stop_codon:yes gene_type:complete